MTLRKKTLLISIVISLLLISLINASTRFILLKNISHLEEKYCLDNIRRASNAVTYEKNDLLTKVIDYAVWDETYRFTQDLNPAYVSSNLQPNTFTNLNLNFIIVLNPSGQVITSYAYDLIYNQPLALSADILDLIAKNQIFHSSDLRSQGSGFIQGSGRPVLIAYHSILTSKALGPSHGILIFGKYLEENFTKQLSDVTHLSMQIEPYRDSELSRELQTAQRVKDNESELAVKILDSQSIAGYQVFEDVSGSPLLILRAVMERDIYNQGHATILFFISVVFFGSVFFLVTAVTLLDKQVISRITTLSQSVIKVRLSGTLVDRVAIKGSDEISFLGREINEMLGSLEAADDSLRQSRDELERRIEDRTAELTQVNEELKYEIAERELGQKALFEAYNENHLILNSISSILIGVNSDGIVTQWNDVAFRLFGLASVDALGQDFFTLPIQWDWDNFSRNVTDCVKHNRKVRMEDLILIHPDSSQRILGITLTPLARDDQARPGFLLIGSDITERRLLEQQVGRSNKLEAIGQLTAGVAHEINTPTQLVGSNLRFLGQYLAPVLEVIEKGYQLNRAVIAGTASPESALILERAAAAAHVEFFKDEAPKAIEQSLEGIERIAHIVAAMGFFMHPGSENKELANLNTIIHNALSLSRNEWKNIAEIETDLDPDLPAIECLPSDLSQVVLNLIINAVHAIQDAAGEEPELKGRIVITSRQVEESVEFRVADTGIGIPNEIRNKIFDLFFTTKEVGRGTGQGLAIAYTVIVKKHGGTIEFESDLGHGTTFIIRIPMKAGQV